MIVGSFAKTATEIKNFSVDWEDALDEGDSITDHEVTPPAGLTLDASQIIGTTLVAVVSGGTAGESYVVPMEISTAADLLLQAEVLVTIVSPLVVGENTYGTLADADAYHALRANTDWLGADVSLRIAALVKATQYIDGKYLNWIGSGPTDPDQLLAWPREDAEIGDRIIDADAIPVELERATFEAALREIRSAGFLLPDLSADNSGIIREAVGSIEVEYSQARISRPSIPAVDDALGILLTSPPSGGSSFLMRA